MKKFSFLLAASALSAGSMIVAAPAAAQQTTSGIQGDVRAEDGSVISGATVVVTDTRTGASSTLRTEGQGRFAASNLPTGGPYTVTVTADGYQGQTVNDLFINLSGATSLSFELTAVSGDVSSEAIIITGARASETVLAIGPGQSIGTETLEALPTITRDIRDFIRIDPRVSLDRANEVDRISCLGGNDRSNVFTVDGIAQADVFGLNGTPFASRNSLPLPFDAVKETAIEFAPFDVEYGNFTGCAINVVTKSGTNEFHGSAFFTFRNEDLRGDTAGGESFIPAEFEEKRWGATLGGPIIKDRLFFFLGYEEADTGDSVNEGPVGAGFPNELNFVTEAQFNEFSQIVRDVYGRETGGIVRSTPEMNERYFARVDAYITDDHRLEGTYQKLEELNVEADYGGNAYTGYNSFEAEGTNSDYYSLRFFSDWTDNFSTELRWSRAEVGDVQGPVGGGEAQSDNPKPRLAVAVATPECGTSDAPTPDAPGCEIGYLTDGPGIFRSANQLDTVVEQWKAAANLRAGNHFFTIGAERNKLDVFNLFAINATGTLYFRDFDALREGLLNTGRDFFPDAEETFVGSGYGADINATPTGDINEAAAEWSRTIWSGYIQDDWAINDQLNLLFGTRVDFYSGSRPKENPNFVERYGFSNATSFDDIDAVWLPRAAFTYNFDNDGTFYSTQLKGGVGIFSGGDPTVWFSNAFSNNGFSTGLGTERFADCSGEPMVDGRIDVVTNGQFTGFPDCIRANGSDSAARGLADTQSTDPNIKIPTVLRMNLGLSTRFGDGSGGFFDDWSVNLDYIYSRFRNPYNFVDLSQVIDPDEGLGGFTVDGRPIYRPIDPTQSGCNAQLVSAGTPPVWTGVTDDCFGTRRDDEIMLTNADGYDSHTASVILRKRFNGGVFTDGGRVFLNLGYAYTDADERRTNDNSTATSGYDRTAAFDRQDPAIRTSTYQNTHNFTAAVNFKEEFFDDFETSFGMVFRGRSGRPYSLTFDGGGVFNDSSSGSDNALLYVPFGINDPNLSPNSDPNAVAQLVDYVANSGCDFEFGKSIEGNSCRNDWFFDLDLRLSQEIPGPARLFGVNDRVELFIDFDNFLNFLDGSWNALRTRDRLVDVVDVEIDDQGRYEITGFNPDDDNDVLESASVWRAQVGIKYEF
ncbi:outer membrane beta-barrel protein [Sphingomicrobium lutaoense]|uniref:TonB-dependent transporter Oar-like beta-barrel domain-containing protein n=1 Tax=Sphingomicrobium lutaoense TaxID=515949 RepID=A0A839Z398_9SPHN|nr:carboxypeptidase regulatory-like domain-containing protein [Sphingomicrobium lutaoense]MBB3764055.1 hypothetical protein [Sphingomicrobium lutaoense]